MWSDWKPLWNNNDIIINNDNANNNNYDYDKGKEKKEIKETPK